MDALVRKTGSQDSAKIAELHREGSLDHFSSRSLLTELSRQRWSGMIELRSGERIKRLWMKHGRIGHLQSNMRSELIQESSSLTPDHLRNQERMHFVSSLIQSLTWTKGTFRLSPEKSSAIKESDFEDIDIFLALGQLLDIEERATLSTFSDLRLWADVSGPFSLAAIPIWNFLASVRIRGLSGVLILRKENKFFELVIKQGIPVIFYEGSFAKPRQHILVRQQGAEHEDFFIDQVFNLMSFTTGSAFFRPFEMEASAVAALEAVESTAVLPEEEINEAKVLTSTKALKRFARKVLRLFTWRS